MQASSGAISRRRFLARSGAAAAAASAAHALAGDAAAPKRVAAVLTEFTYRSHAHVILENFLEPYLFNGKVIDPRERFKIVSFYVDQFPEQEMARQVANEYGIPIYPSIGEALRLGGDKLACDAVLSIGEHGRYPSTDRWQIMYPRKRFFDEIAAVCAADGRGVAVFSDKHLSYRWDWAKEMIETAERLHMPLMAGSSVPLAERRPPLEIPAGAPLVEAVAIHGGGVESYDFHCLEVLESLFEARRGGESGVRRVQFLEGADLWKAADEGRWSTELAEAAMRAELGNGLPPLRQLADSDRIGKSPPHGILLDYVDGKRAIALKLGSSGIRWNFACKLEGESTLKATSFYVGPWQNRNLFKALSHAIQAHFQMGKAPYPVERTLLVTGVLAAAMDSRFEKGKPIDTPHLAIRYPPRDFRALREMGQTWKIVTEDAPEPKGMDSAKLHLRSS